MKNILITGVSDTDPYTNIKFEVLDENNKKLKEINSNKAFIDGAMLNILRKSIKINNPINDIYIYLTKDMEIKKDIYIKAIENLYSYYGVNTDLKNIKFYPNDFYEDYTDRLRKADVHKFASYYKEIYDIYSSIQNENKKEINIILNISSGTPAFKADMMMMAVTNNLRIEQTSNIINEEIKENIKEYCKEEIINENNKIEVRSIKNITYPENNIEEILKKLNITEDRLTTRTEEESFDETKKVMILESIEDSIIKKDYCGIYNTLVENKEYLGKNKEQILLISKNLYFRYIGNDKKATENIEDAKIQEYYPIYKFKKILNNDVDEINLIIEKFNMMQIKSKRNEINDWLLISTPLLEAIASSLVKRKLGFDFETILKDSKISLDEFNKKAPDRIKNKFNKPILENKGFLNIYFYKDIMLIIKDNLFNSNEKNKISKILDYIDIINIARADRVTAAHSIKNVDRETFTVEYEKNLKEQKRYWKLEGIIKKHYAGNKFQSIECVEDSMKNLIWELISNNNPLNQNVFIESINVYEKLENNILKLLREEMYEKN